MKLLWSKSPQPAYDIIRQLATDAESWSGSTVKTLLARLFRKRAVGIRRYKNLFLYYPLVTEDACLHGESRSFVERFFDGSVKRLLLHFVQREKLTEKDLVELKKVLDKVKKA